MFDHFSAELLARFQFAFTVSFHIVFPAFSIGLASYLAVLNGLWLKTGREIYLQVFEYWKKIFAVAFGMGVVSGIVMSYQFGTNWAVFADKTGPVLGPLMAYEVLSAFFLEAGFLGIMLFGRKRVGPRLHMFATAMVAVGTLMSATWILSVNSWMQTPAGYGMNAVGQFVPEDWWAIVLTRPFPIVLCIWCWLRISRPPLRLQGWGRGICCGGRMALRHARCSPWRCGWRCWLRRSKFLQVMRMG